MRKASAIVLLLVFCGLIASGRILQVLDAKTMFANSKLVFVGRVKNVKPSGITTKLSYPTWEKVVFEWLQVDVDVIEPLKGCKKGDVVHTAMLSIQGVTNQPGMVYLINQPGMLHPQKGEAFLLFLLPTPMTNLFASLTAPYDDDQAIFHLDGTDGYPYRQDKLDTKSPFYERSVLIRSLLTESGEISPKGAELVRKKYATQIRKSPKKELIYLEWEKETNRAGWSTDVPKSFLSQTNRKAD